jgi:A/G-specific adenine glycosylase
VSTATPSRRGSLSLESALLAWYAREHRDLPWRAPERTPWGVLVSEVMLQQTPVVRVLPVWRAWMSRWPTPESLAAEAPGEAVVAWGRLGYPRRALRLHGAARACVDDHGGAVPSSPEELRRLPGVGSYTAAAVAAFAFGLRTVVLDTNIRRVIARVDAGAAFEPAGAPSAAERARAAALLPDDPATSVRWNTALMELGALVCTARSPRCAECPLANRCQWLAAGSPAWNGPPRRGQTYEGTDRQARGRLLGVLREASGTVGAHELDDAWPEPEQRARALAGLIGDGLVETVPGRRYRLPGRGSVPTPPARR